jgi:hypothetical protein
VRAQLVRGSLASEPADILHATCQAIALALELLEAKQARAAERLGLVHARCVGWNVRKAGGDETRKLQLETRHLRAQRAPGCCLIERPLRREGRGTAVERQLLNRGAHAASSS